MHILSIIGNLFSDLDPSYLTGLIVKVAVLLSLFWLAAGKFSPGLRRLTYVVVLVGFLRIILFGQPFAWKYYIDHINGLDIGWRPQGALYVEYYKFFKPVPKKFLAVGSSQSYMIYMDYSKTHSDLTLFELAGMTPIDLYLYRDYIGARKAEYILLYLSDFDLAREPELEKAKIAPAQGLGWLQIYPVVREIAHQAHTQPQLREMIAGEFFPEIKYDFVFKGLLHKSNAQFQESVLGGEKLEENISDWTGRIDSRWIPYQKDFLRRFLEFCRSHALKVVIVEGQYNPKAYDAKTLAANRTVRQDLEKLAQEFGAVFVPRSKLTPLTQDDYTDAVHLKPESGYRFAESLFKTLQTIL
jgi:hypothetical protein